MRMSSATAGSAPSLIVTPAVVWGTKTSHAPSPPVSRAAAATCLVMSTSSRRARVRTWISRISAPARSRESPSGGPCRGVPLKRHAEPLEDHARLVDPRLPGIGVAGLDPVVSPVVERAGTLGVHPGGLEHSDALLEARFGGPCPAENLHRPGPRGDAAEHPPGVAQVVGVLVAREREREPRRFRRLVDLRLAEARLGEEAIRLRQDVIAGG